MTAPLRAFDVDLAGLFEGYGGLTLAAQSVLGGRLGWYSEIEPAACRVLAHHHPDVPNLGDITAIDWATVPRPRILTGGFPCQDVSSAGRRLGIRPGSRSGLWTHMAYAIDQLRPELVVIENVRGLLSADAACDVEPCPWCLGDDEGRPLRALGAVLGDLGQLGYDARWGGLRAADVGAPHGRYRIFITAWPRADSDTAGVGRWPEGRDDRLRPAGLVAGAAADTTGARRRAAEDGRAGACDEGARLRGAESERDGSARTVADSARIGRGEGRPEPARLIGGPDAPVGGALAAGDPDGIDRDGWTAAGLQGQARPPAGPAPDADCVGPVRGGAARGRRSGPADHDLAATHADGAGPQGGGLRGPTGPALIGGGSRATTWGVYAPAIRRWEHTLGRVAPAPTMTSARGGQQLSPAFVEWMQGLPPGWVTGVPGISRNEQLKMLGNGVVPQQAAAALRWLLATAGEVAA